MLAVVSSGGCFLLRGAAGALGLWLRPVLQQQATCASHVFQGWSDGSAQGSISIRYPATLQRSLRQSSRVEIEISRLLSSVDAAESSAVQEQAQGAELKPPLTPPNSENSLAKARRLARFDEEGEYRVFRELLEGEKTRFVSRVSYDGTNYTGFQLQKGLPTVQVSERQ